MDDTSAAVKPPSTLKDAGRALWTAIQAAYSIADAGGLSLLLSACRAEDDITKFRELVEEDGVQIVDRFGALKPHPLLASIRDCESTKRQALKMLNLDPDPEPATKPGRR